jgi:anthranilate phosphoribosyltransferase
MRHHPAMRHAAGPRRSVGFPTIFNLLGPLTNPAQAPRQLLGVYRPELVDPIARALARLGAESALVVHGGGGLDEASTLGPNTVGRVERGADGAVAARLETLDPASLGLGAPPLEAIQASDLDDGVRRVLAVLAGEPGAGTDIVLLNAALGLVVAGAAETAADGLDRASRAIDSGGAERALERLIAASAE